MNLYAREFDPGDRIQSAASHWSAAAARLSASVVLSIPQLPDATWLELRKVLTVESLWCACIVLAGWAIATIVGGVVGLLVNGLLIAYGVVELWEQLGTVGNSLRRWVVAAYEAKNRGELTAAGRHFADALSVGGVTALEILITHRVFRAAEGRLRRAMPVPTWLRAQYDDVVRVREQRKRSAEKTPSTEVARRVGEVARVARDAGVKRAAEFPTEAVAVAGALAAMAGVCGVAWAVAASDKKRDS